MDGWSSQGATPGARCRGQTPYSRHEPAPDNSHYVRRVVLPSGRAIEVVYFDAQPAPADAEPVVSSPERDLHVCPECDRDLVYPVEWEEASADALGGAPALPELRVDATSASSTRPPSTASTRSSTAAPRRSSRDLKRLTQANMEDEIERFAAALAADAHLADGLLAR